MSCNWNKEGLGFETRQPEPEVVLLTITAPYLPMQGEMAARSELQRLRERFITRRNREDPKCCLWGQANELDVRSTNSSGQPQEWGEVEPG